MGERRGVQRPAELLHHYLITPDPSLLVLLEFSIVKFRMYSVVAREEMEKLICIWKKVHRSGNLLQAQAHPSWLENITAV